MLLFEVPSDRIDEAFELVAADLGDVVVEVSLVSPSTFPSSHLKNSYGVMSKEQMIPPHTKDAIFMSN